MMPDQVWEYRETAKAKDKDKDKDKARLKKVLEYPEPVRLPYFGGVLAKGGVPTTWVSAVPKPRALLVEAYGAYGISARRAYPVRWLPYLAAGWAVAYASPRGGREGGDAWWDAARGAVRKHRTFEDTAAAIRALQHSLHIPPAATVFFGRSAGGWLAANLAQEHGNLVAAVYAEVPYVDVLATTGNPALPLTQLEYDEFGDPRRPQERRALQKLSPVDTVPACRPAACPLLVIRTGLHDKQVLPYEALKWSAQLRLAGWPRVYVGIDHAGGHFAGEKSMVEQRAEDAAILDACIQESSLTNSALLETSLKRSNQGPRAARVSRKKSVKRQVYPLSGKTRRRRSRRA
jgi:protease II